MFEFEEIDYNDSPVESDEIVNDQTDDSSNEQLEHQAVELETESTDVLTGTDEIVEQEDAEIEVDSEGVQTDAEEIVEQYDAEPNTTDVDDGKTDLSNYRVIIDDMGIDIDPNKDPLEGTKNVIGHSELEDALWANEINRAERMKDLAEKMQTGDYDELDFGGPMRDMDDIRREYDKNEYEIYAFRKVNKWSKDSYTEEDNP